MKIQQNCEEIRKIQKEIRKNGGKKTKDLKKMAGKFEKLGKFSNKNTFRNIKIHKNGGEKNGNFFRKKN